MWECGPRFVEAPGRIRMGQAGRQMSGAKVESNHCDGSDMAGWSTRDFYHRGKKNVDLKNKNVKNAFFMRKIKTLKNVE